MDAVHFLVSFDGVDYKRERVELSLPELYRRMVEEPEVFLKTAAPIGVHAGPYSIGCGVIQKYKEEKTVL